MKYLDSDKVSTHQAFERLRDSLKKTENFWKFCILILIGNILNLTLQTQTCVPTVQLYHCNTKFENDLQWFWRRDRSYTIHSIAKRSCQDSTLEYQWIITDQTGHLLKQYTKLKNRMTFTLDYFELGFGNWTLVLTVNEVKKSLKHGTSSAKDIPIVCIVKVTTLYTLLKKISGTPQFCREIDVLGACAPSGAYSRNDVMKYAGGFTSKSDCIDRYWYSIHCLITIMPQTPTPEIEGGTYREVPSDKSFIVDGKLSKNRDVRPGTGRHLHYRWFCTANATIDNFCSPTKSISHADQVTIPASRAIDSVIYEFELRVSTDNSEWVSTKQTVKVKRDATKHILKIICMKNCQGWVHTQWNIYLQVKCKTCTDKSLFRWNLKHDEDKKNKTWLKPEDNFFKLRGNKMYINQEGPTENERKFITKQSWYTFYCSYDGKDQVSYTLRTQWSWPKSKCDWTPTKGTSLEQIFTAKCYIINGYQPAVIYKLYTGGYVAENLMDIQEKGQFKVRLADAGGKKSHLVRAIDVEGFFGDHEQVLEVTAATSEHKGNIKEQMKIVLDAYGGTNPKYQSESVESMIASGNFSYALQWIYILSLEVQAMLEGDTPAGDKPALNEFKRNWQWTALNDLKKIPLDSLDRIYQVTISLLAAEKLIQHRSFRLEITRMMPALVNKYRQFLSESPNPDAWTLEIELEIKYTYTLASLLLRPNPADMGHEPLHFDFTTPKYFLDLPGVKENYPNYDDADLQYAKKLRDYQEISVNAVKLFELTGLMILQAVYPGEPSKAISVLGYDQSGEPKDVEVLIQLYVNDATDFTNKEVFGKFNCYVNITSSVITWRGNIALIVVAYKERKGFVWWLEKTLSASVLDISVYRNGRSVGRMPKPIKFKFDDVNIEGTVKNIPPKQSLVTAPEDLDKWKPEYLDYNMTVHRIRVKRGGMLFTHFKDIQGKSLAVVVTFNRRPNYQDFTETPPIFIQGSSDAFSNRTIRSTFPHPLLKYGDTYAYIAVLPVKSDAKSGLKGNISRKYSVSFAVAMCLLWNPPTKDWLSKFCSVIFLSDNVQSERYAYLVAIKTGNKEDAGTTSNVGMKIFGNKRDSMAHLLNYPDPSKNLLQRDEEDWFVLTAEKHLGIVQRLQLWHDSVGQRPSWYCDWLTITDLQTLDEWYFNVKTWFSVTREEHCKLVLEPSDPDSKKTRYKKKFLERIKKQNTWNMCSKEGLSYVQRITLMLSIVVTTYASALMLYGIPRMQLYDGLGHGHFEITMTTIHITIESAVVSFCLNTVFVKLFKMTKGSKSILYRLISILTWLSIAFTILACLTFLVVFSFWIPYLTSLLWLFSTSGAMIIIIFLLENVYLVLTTLLQKIQRVKVPSVTRTALVQEIERQREKLYSTFGETLFRSHFRDKYRALTREEWKIKRQRELARLQISHLLKDVTMFAIYIILLYCVALANKDAYDVYGHKEMKNIVYGLHTRTRNFKDIKSFLDFESYMNQTLIPNIFALHWYGNSNIKHSGLLSDFNTKIINVAKYRQLRYRKHCCKAPDVMKDLNLTCTPEFSPKCTDEGEYEEFWKIKKYQVVPRLISVWKYQHDAISVVGEAAVYPGGGYIGHLDKTVYNTFYDLRYYRRAHWIDKRTSVIFIEFLVYNCNNNIFHAMTLMVEHSVSGLFFNTAKSYTARLLYRDNKLKRTDTFIFICFVIITFVMFLSNLNAARKGLKTYFKDGWNILDVVIILMSFLCIVLYIHRATVIGQLLQRLQQKHNQVISYFDIIDADEMFKVVAAILVFVATVRLCKLLTFGTKFKIMERMARLFDKHLFCVFIFHMIILLMYSFTGNLMFGSYFKEFQYISVSMTTLILLSVNLAPKFDYERFADASLGYTFYVSYMLVTVTIFTLYIAVIIIAHGESASSYSNIRQYYSFTRYIFDEFHYIKGLVKKGINYVRLSAGADDKATPKKVTPKDNKYRYANAVTLSKEKLHTMNLVALCVIKNYIKEKKEEETISEEGITLMTQMVYNMLKPEEDEYIPGHDFVAFATNDKDGKRVLVKDETLLKMEYIANYVADKTTEMDSKVMSLEGEETRVFDKTTIQGRLAYLEHILQNISALFDNIKIVYE